MKPKTNLSVEVSVELTTSPQSTVSGSEDQADHSAPPDVPQLIKEIEVWRDVLKAIVGREAAGFLARVLLAVVAALGAHALPPGP